MKRLLSAGALATMLMLLTVPLARAQQCGDYPSCISISQCQKITQPGLYVVNGSN